MNTTVENYLINGCERCPLGGTDGCKVHRWTLELKKLRKLVLDCGLTEACKWGVPCYTYEGKNVLIISAFKEYCGLNFFKGTLLNDKEGLLVKPGKNSQAARQIRFESLDRIIKFENQIRNYINQAIEVEKQGLTVKVSKSPDPIPAELEQWFEKDPLFKSAFESLTPGRQRGYVLFFSGAKQSKTIDARIEKSISKILNGEGLHDHYKKKN